MKTAEETRREACTAKITVYEPCECERCSNGGRWFQCLDPIIIETYDCSPFDGIKDAPHPDAVAEVEKLHPGKIFRYIKMF